MKIVDIAFVMLVVHGCFAIVSSPQVQPFGTNPFGSDYDQVTRTDIEAGIPTAPDEEQATSESFLSTAIGKVTGVGGFFASLKDTFFMGSFIRNIMHHSTGMGLPDALVLLFDAISAFIYTFAIIQLFLRFRAE